jgi:hypothetical protein
MYWLNYGLVLTEGRGAAALSSLRDVTRSLSFAESHVLRTQVFRLT